MAATFEPLLASDFSARCHRPLARATQIQRDHVRTLTIAHVLKRDGPQSGPETVARLRSELPPAAQNADLILRAGSSPQVLSPLAAAHIVSSHVLTPVTYA